MSSARVDGCWLKGLGVYCPCTAHAVRDGVLDSPWARRRQAEEAAKDNVDSLTSCV